MTRTPPPPAVAAPPSPAQLEQWRHSHDLLANFSRCLPGMFYQFRLWPDGRSCFPYASDAVCQLFGVSAAQIHDDAGPLFAAIHPDDLPALLDGVQRSARELAPWHHEYRVGAEQQRWLLGHATPEAQPDGSVLWHGFITDITERKLTEQKLVDAERKMRLVMKASNQGLYDFNIQTGEGSISPEYARMLGYEPEELAVSKKFWAYFWGEGVHPDDVAGLKRAYQAHFASHGASDYHAEFRQKAKSGEWRWIMSHGSVIEWDRQGRAVRMVGTHIDITERKRTEQILRQNQEWQEASKNRYKELARELEILISNAPVGIMFVSDGNIIRANQVLAELCHFPNARAMIGLKTTFLYQDQEDYQAFGAQVIPKLLADEPVELEWRLRRADGASFMARVAGRALPAETYTRGAVWMIEDITEQRRTLDALRDSEQRLQKLMNSSLIGILQGAGRGRITQVNDVFVQLSGYSREELLNQDSVRDALLSEQDFATLRNAYAELRDHGSTAPFEVTLRQRDGHGIPILAGLSHLGNSRREWVLFVMDISERLRINQLKTAFISVVSHELRTPLTSIRGSLSLLESGVAGTLPARAAHLIRIAHNNSRRLITLVSDILDMDKLASGKMSFKSEAVDLVGLLQHAIEANSAYATTLQVSLQLVAAPAQAWVVADHDRLMQVLANLLSNAAKFSAAGQSVQLRLLAQDGRYRVEVCDQGCGIPAEFQPQLFEPFTQADGSDTRQQGGTGLGLSISKAFIESMHGQLGFASTPGRGTTFWFEFTASR